MVGNGGVARRLVAAIASAALVAGLVPAPALAEAAEEFQAAQDVGALEVAEGSGDGAPDVADGGSGDGGLEAVGDVVTLGAASEEPVVASVQATITGTIGSASYAFDDSTGVLQVSGGSFTLGVWNGAFGNSIEKSSVKAVVFADAKVTGSTKLMFSGFDVSGNFLAYCRHPFAVRQ